MIDDQVIYSFKAELGGDFKAAIAQVLEALKKAEFAILSDADLGSILPAAGAPEYHVISVCRPKLMQQALKDDPDIGLLFPSQVIVRRDPQRNVVVAAFIDLVSVLALTNNPEMTRLGWEERGQLERVRDALAGGSLGH